MATGQPTAGDDYQLQHSDDDEAHDIITEEQTDDAAVDLGVTHTELRDGLDRLDGNDPDVPETDQDEAADDMREALEDADQSDRE